MRFQKAAIAAALVASGATGSALAEDAAAPPAVEIPCALSGSASVTINGRAMLRLGDVAGCPGVRYEIIPGMTVNGEPAVRLLPDEDCAPSGEAGVLIDGEPAQTVGSAVGC